MMALPLSKTMLFPDPIPPSLHKAHSILLLLARRMASERLDDILKCYCSHFVLTRGIPDNEMKTGPRFASLHFRIGSEMKTRPFSDDLTWTGSISDCAAFLISAVSPNLNLYNTFNRQAADNYCLAILQHLVERSSDLLH